MQAGDAEMLHQKRQEMKEKSERAGQVSELSMLEAAKGLGLGLGHGVRGAFDAAAKAGDWDTAGSDSKLSKEVEGWDEYKKFHDAAMAAHLKRTRSGIFWSGLWNFFTGWIGMPISLLFLGGLAYGSLRGAQAARRHKAPRYYDDDRTTTFTRRAPRTVKVD